LFFCFSYVFLSCLALGDISHTGNCEVVWVVKTENELF
jgi:hypothetical protein